MIKKVFLFTALLSLILSCNRAPRETTSSADREIDHRVDSVLAKMTLEEKVGQMNQISTGGAATGPVLGSNDDMADLRAGKIGSILNLVGAERTRKAQEIAVKETRLGIPAYFRSGCNTWLPHHLPHTSWRDCKLGYCRDQGIGTYSCHRGFSTGSAMDICPYGRHCQGSPLGQDYGRRRK